MRFQCANCKHVLHADSEKAGKALACEECGCVVAVPPHRYAPGVVIGDFRIISKIGEGAVGTVYYSHQISLDRPAALKILHNGFAENVNYRERFLQEARTAAKLNHPGIVQAYAVGEDEGDYYFAMEFVEGSTLKKVLAHSGSIMLQRAVAIVKQIAEALDFAWTNAKMVHRDIKPDNIILTEDGEAKLADLGLAKVGGDFLNEDAENVFGTPQYIAPEQLMGEPVDCRTDIYSLGATFYQLVTGRYPYTGTDPGDISRKHLYETLTPPNKLVPEIPESVSLLIRLMMAKRPESRYQTPGELLKDLENIEKGKQLNRELPADSQQLFSPEEVEPKGTGGGKGAAGAASSTSAVGAGGTHPKRKLTVSRSKRPTSSSSKGRPATPNDAEESDKTDATSSAGKRRIKVDRDSKPRLQAGRTGAAPPVEESAEAEQSEPFESGAKEGSERGSNRAVKVLLTILILLVLGGGGGAGYWYYTYVYNAPDDGDSGTVDRAEELVAEVKSQMKSEDFDEALKMVNDYVQSDSPDSEVAARLRELVAPALELQVRQLREPRIREQRGEWKERADELVEQARLEAERERERREAEQRQKERELELERQREREERRLAELNERRQEVRRRVVENCRQREYSRARLVPLSLQSVDEKEFSEWAKKMETMVRMAKECYETVSGSDELLEGFECLPENWPDSNNIVGMQVNFISSNSVFLRFTRKVYEEGVFQRNESGIANVKFEDVKPAAMGRLFDEAWERAEGGGLVRRDQQFAAYLIAEARALDMAESRLEGTTGDELEFMEQEIEAVRELGL